MSSRLITSEASAPSSSRVGTMRSVLSSECLRIAFRRHRLYQFANRRSQQVADRTALSRQDTGPIEAGKRLLVWRGTPVGFKRGRFEWQTGAAIGSQCVAASRTVDPPLISRPFSIRKLISDAINAAVTPRWLLHLTLDHHLGMTEPTRVSSGIRGPHDV